jgi:hypothetical protein
MSAELYGQLIERIELGENTPDLVDAIHALAPEPKVIQPSNYLRSFDAALLLLPEGSDWRRFTPRSCSVYAASPYNAKAEVRHDGYGPTPAAQLCAAIFKMHLAKAKQMERIR